MSRAHRDAVLEPRIGTLEKNIELKSVKRLCDGRKGSFLEKIVLSAIKDKDETGRVEQICRIDYDTITFGAFNAGGPSLYTFSRDEVKSLYLAHGRKFNSPDEIAWQKANDSHLPIAHPIACCALPDLKTVIMLDGRHFCLWTFNNGSGDGSIVSGLAGIRGCVDGIGVKSRLSGQGRMITLNLTYAKLDLNAPDGVTARSKIVSNDDEAGDSSEDESEPENNEAPKRDSESPPPDDEFARHPKNAAEAEEQRIKQLAERKRAEEAEQARRIEEVRQKKLAEEKAKVDRQRKLEAIAEMERKSALMRLKEEEELAKRQAKEALTASGQNKYSYFLDEPAAVAESSEEEISPRRLRQHSDSDSDQSQKPADATKSAGFTSFSSLIKSDKNSNPSSPALAAAPAALDERGAHLNLKWASGITQIDSYFDKDIGAGAVPAETSTATASSVAVVPEKTETLKQQAGSSSGSGNATESKTSQSEKEALAAAEQAKAEKIARREARQRRKRGILDPEFAVLISDPAFHVIRLYNLQSKELKTIVGTIGKSGEASNQLLNEPMGMCLDGLGRLLIANRGGNNILRFDPTKPEHLAVIGCSSTSRVEQFVRQPTDIVMDPLGNFFISSEADNAIYKAYYDDAGESFHVSLLTTISSPRSLYFDHASVLLSNDVLLFAASKFDVVQVKLRKDAYTKATQRVYDSWQTNRHRLARQFGKPLMQTMIDNPQLLMQKLNESANRTSTSTCAWQ